MEKTGGALNYFRQFRKFYSNSELARWDAYDPTYAKAVRHFIKLGRSAVKFILPEGGRLLGVATPTVEENAKLPFEVVLLEYTNNTGPIREGTIAAPKRITLAIQASDEEIAVYSAVSAPNCRWVLAPVVMKGCFRGQYVEDIRSYALSDHADSLSANDRQGLQDDMMEEAGAVASLLMALSCRNVTHVSSGPVKSSTKKGAIPFDEYRVLVLKAQSAEKINKVSSTTAAHRSPREHLRRGHIRQLGSGSRVWVQASVVNPGVGGTIRRAYRVSSV